MATISKYETASGPRYRVRYRKPDGTQTDKRGFKTKREANAFADTTEVSKLRGEYIDPVDGKVTIGELYATFIVTKSALKPSWVRTLKSSWKNHVRDEWEHRPIASIRPSEVQAWVSSMSAAKSSATVVRRAYGILAGVLDIAVADNLIGKNVARGMTLPEKFTKARPYLSHLQVDLLCDQLDEARAAFVFFAAYSGPRWSEAIALRKRHMNIDRRIYTVEENAVQLGSEFKVGTPKSGEKRNAPMPLFVADRIAPLLEGRGRNDLVFPGADGGYMKRPKPENGWFTKAVEAAQVIDPTFPTITPHDLRHTTASLAISAGANVKTLQRMLGHKRASMTLDIYADLFETDLDHIGIALDAARTSEIVGKVWAKPVQITE